jgi:copper chaperone
VSELSETRAYLVEGMTCNRCRFSVAEELGGVRGVEGVEVRPDDGRAVVTGNGLADADIVAAVAEAGYTARRV